MFQNAFDTFCFTLETISFFCTHISLFFNLRVNFFFQELPLAYFIIVLTETGRKNKNQTEQEQHQNSRPSFQFIFFRFLFPMHEYLLIK